jgi:hypothetical protein
MDKLSELDRETVSRIAFFVAIGTALPGIVEKVMTEGPVNPSVRLLM